MSSIYLSNAIFMMIILTIIFLRIRYYITWSQSKKYTMIFIGMVELYVLMDALFMKELLGKSGNLLQFKLVVFFFYLVYVIMPYVWHLFMQSYMGINRSKKQRFAEMIPFILLVLMVLLSVPTGIVWRFSRNRTYIRGTFFGVFAVLESGLVWTQNLKVHTIGDSTMADYMENTTRTRGWGEMLQEFFSKEVQVINYARGGRSSRSFWKEGRWDKVKENISPGDYEECSSSKKSTCS